MKKVIILISLLCMLQNGQALSKGTSELLDIINAMETTELVVSSWELIGREKISEKKMEKIKKHLINQGFTENTSEKNTVNLHTYEKNEQNKVKISVAMIKANNKSATIHLQAKITSEEWDEKSERNIEMISEEFMESVFTNRAAYFTCIKFENNGIIDDSAHIMHFLKELNVVEKQSQSDNIEKSAYEFEFYGYIESWDSHIDVDNMKINMQIVTRKTLNDKRQTIIGTPVILNEY